MGNASGAAAAGRDAAAESLRGVGRAAAAIGGAATDEVLLVGKELSKELGLAPPSVRFPTFQDLTLEGCMSAGSTTNHEDITVTKARSGRSSYDAQQGIVHKEWDIDSIGLSLPGSRTRLHYDEGSSTSAGDGQETDEGAEASQLRSTSSISSPSRQVSLTSTMVEVEVRDAFEQDVHRQPLEALVEEPLEAREGSPSREEGDPLLDRLSDSVFSEIHSPILTTVTLPPPGFQAAPGPAQTSRSDLTAAPGSPLVSLMHRAASRASDRRRFEAEVINPPDGEGGDASNSNSNGISNSDSKSTNRKEDSKSKIEDGHSHGHGHGDSTDKGKGEDALGENPMKECAEAEKDKQEEEEVFELHSYNIKAVSIREIPVETAGSLADVGRKSVDSSSGWCSVPSSGGSDVLQPTYDRELSIYQDAVPSGRVSKAKEDIISRIRAEAERLGEEQLSARKPVNSCGDLDLDRTTSPRSPREGPQPSRSEGQSCQHQQHQDGGDGQVQSQSQSSSQSFFKRFRRRSDSVLQQHPVALETVANAACETSERAQWRLGSMLEVYSASLETWSVGRILKVEESSEDLAGSLSIQFADTSGAMMQKSVPRFHEHLAPLGTHTGEAPPNFRALASVSRPGCKTYEDLVTGSKYMLLEHAWAVHFSRVLQGGPTMTLPPTIPSWCPQRPSAA